MPKETLTTRMAVVEKELEMRKEIFDMQFETLNEKLDTIQATLKNGHIKNGSGMKDKMVLWAMRIAVFGLAGKQGAEVLLK